MSYLEVLLLVHVGTAIVGFGPTFAFAILGPMGAKTGGPQALGILKGMAQIEKVLVRPAIVLQLVSGILLIIEENLDEDFFSHYWLWIAIVIFVTAAYIATALQTPIVDKMIELAESGNAQTPEFEANGKKAATYGPILNVMLLAIIFLMVVKPGG